MTADGLAVYRRFLTAPENEMSNIVMQWTDSGNKTHKIDIETDDSSESFLHAFRSFLYVCGFHEDTIHEMLNEDESGNAFGESMGFGEK